MLQVKHLKVCFSSQGKSFEAVQGISFELDPQDSLGIIGESGSGKSACIDGISRLSSGKVSGYCSFEGKEFRRPIPEIGVIFQDPTSFLNPTMKVGWQIAEGIIYHKIASKKEAKKKTLELLDLVGIQDPEKRFHLYPHQLSGGMRQRVLIAIALARSPKLLIADEPTTALDHLIENQILDLILQMQKKFGMALILVSHDFRVIQKMCRRLIVIQEGKVVEEGLTQEIFQNPKHPYTQKLTLTRPKIPLRSLIKEPKPQEELLELRQISKTYFQPHPFQALFPTQLCLKTNETLGIIGESGSGKSTLGKIILGSLQQTSGQVLYKGVEKKGFLPKKIQMIFQDSFSCLNPRMNVESLLLEPFQIQKEDPKVDDLLDLVSLPYAFKSKYPHELSGGQRQRIVIARALALNPELLIADEPISSLDAPIQYQILSLLKKLQQELGLSLLFIGHDLLAVRSIADRMAVMHQGKIIEENTTESLFLSPHENYTKSLLFQTS